MFLLLFPQEVFRAVVVLLHIELKLNFLIIKLLHILHPLLIW